MNHMSRARVEKCLPAILFTLVLIVCSASSAFSQAVTVAGRLLEFKSLDKKSFEITVQTSEGKTKYVLDGSTIIEAKIPAEKAKVGQKILVEESSPLTKPKTEATAAQEKDTASKKAPEPTEASLPEPPVMPAGLAERPENPPAQPPRAPEPPAGFEEHPGNPAQPPAPMPPKPDAKAAQTKEAAKDPGMAPPPPEKGQPPQKPAAGKKKKEFNDVLPEDTNDSLAFMGKTTQLEAIPGESAPPAPAEQPAEVAEKKSDIQKILEIQRFSDSVTFRLENDQGQESHAEFKKNYPLKRILNFKDLGKNSNVQLEVLKGSKRTFVRRVTVV